VLRLAATAILVIVPTLVYYLMVDSRGRMVGLFFFDLKHDLQGWLYAPAILFAAVALSWRGFAFTWLAAFLLHLPRTLRFTLSEESLFHNLTFWFLPLLAGAIVTLERKWRATQRQIEMERAQEREVFVQKILMAQEEERRRISKEIHDETLQDLVALAYVADAMLQECPEHEGLLRQQATSIKDNSLRMARELRRISSDLRPSTLDHLGLVPSLRSLADKMGDETRIPTRFTVTGAPRGLNEEAETALFRVVQEALTNVRKHSGATEAWVALEFRRDSLRLEVGDNGQGFTVRPHMERLAAEGHLGLLGIRERVTSLGGGFRVKSRPGTGTVVSLKIPIPIVEAAVSSPHASQP